MLKIHKYDVKYKFLIKNRGDVGTKHLHHSKALIEYSNNMVDIYKNIENCNSNKKRKLLAVLDDMISNNKLNPIVTELFIRDRKVNISHALITQSDFIVPKTY